MRGAEDVEDGADADFAAHWSGVAHGGVEGLGEHEADAPPRLMQRSTPSGGSSIRTPRASRTSAAPQLPEAAPVCRAWRCARPRQRQQGQRQWEMLKLLGAVAPGADGIDHGAFDSDLEGELAHDGGPCRRSPRWTLP